jgi:hypothetical protein
LAALLGGPLKNFLEARLLATDGLQSLAANLSAREAGKV